MKKIIPLIATILLFTACDGNSTNDSEPINEVVKYSSDAIDMKTATENYRSDFEQCKAADYPNLNFENTMVFPVAAINKCRDLEIMSHNAQNQEIEGLMTEKEKVEKLKEYCEFFFGEYNEEYSGFNSWDGNIDSRESLNVDGAGYTVSARISDHMKEIENEAFHIDWFLYVEPYKRNYLWYTPATMKYPFDLNKGGAATILSESGKGVLSFSHGMSEFAWKERVARYFNDGTNNDVTYRLADGDCSIGEAIEYFTNDFWEALPFDEEDKQPYLVRYIDVYRMTDDTYAYFIRFSPVVGASIPFERSISKSVIIPDGTDATLYDADEFSLESQALMIKKNDIDMARSFDPLYGAHETGGEITKIIPLKKAVDTVSEKLTQNVRFNAVEVDLVYHGRNTPSDTATVLRPTWLIRLFNPNDANYYITYVDAVTGDFSVYNYTTQYQP
ncbi:MAG: hypothetical protein J1F04_09440 [Oscillospiraceae bacterium]|nr:hypothetical protein [Oscillospiraceae bacterium]